MNLGQLVPLCILFLYLFQKRTSRISESVSMGCLSSCQTSLGIKHRRKQKILTVTSSLASSFLHPHPVCSGKRRCCLYAGSDASVRTPVLAGLHNGRKWLLLGRIAMQLSTTYLDAAYCYTPSSMVCLSVRVVSRAKTAEPIEMPFGLRTWVDPRNHVLDGCPDPQWEGQF